MNGIRYRKHDNGVFEATTIWYGSERHMISVGRRPLPHRARNNWFIGATISWPNHFPKFRCQLATKVVRLNAFWNRRSMWINHKQSLLKCHQKAHENNKGLHLNQRSRLKTQSTIRELKGHDSELKDAPIFYTSLVEDRSRIRFGVRRTLSNFGYITSNFKGDMVSIVFLTLLNLCCLEDLCY